MKTPENSLQDAIFINEDLTRARANLMYNLRALKKKKKITDVWSNDGTIIIKKNNDDKEHFRTVTQGEKFISNIRQENTD